jgi:hypothetical protein
VKDVRQGLMIFNEGLTESTLTEARLNMMIPQNRMNVRRRRPASARKIEDSSYTAAFRQREPGTWTLAVWGS